MHRGDWRIFTTLLSSCIFLFLAGCVTHPVAGRAREIDLSELTFLESGRASFYSHSFDGKVTASGEIYSPELLTAAHPSLPLGSIVLVRRRVDGRFVVVRVNDRGPFVEGRNIDLSYAAARKLRMLRSGVVSVDLYVIPENSSLAAAL